VSGREWACVRLFQSTGIAGEPEPGHSDRDHLIGFTGTSCSEPGSGCASPIQRPEWWRTTRGAELLPAPAAHESPIGSGEMQ